MSSQKRILVTGCAGFIGSHVTQAFLRRGDCVVGLDNLNDYYDPDRKRANLTEVKEHAGHSGNFTFLAGDIRDDRLIRELFAEYGFEEVIHLAAMAGVRSSVENPALYFDVNLNGTLVLFEASVGRMASGRTVQKVRNFIFAGSSSVYGAGQVIPYTETDPCHQPLAPYPASKRAAELLGYSYHHLYRLNFTSLRFFTVYGPRGRPDLMAYKVLDNIFFGREVPLYNQGQMHRDWTFVDDVVSGVVAAADCPLGYEIINLGRGEPILLADFVRLLEEMVGREARLVAAPMMDADVAYTWADISKARQLLGYVPTTHVSRGVRFFWEWYQKAVLGGTIPPL